jgi:dihydroorotase
MEMPVDRLVMTKPDDWHLHVRDAELMRCVVPESARRFARAIIMPNLMPPITTCDLALAYRDRIVKAIPSGVEFQPLMTLFLTEETPPAEIVAAKASGSIHGVKWYPAGATTNSEHGVHDIWRCRQTLEALQEQRIPLLVHAETPDPEVDVFDREAHFIDHYLAPVAQRFPGLRIVVEHVTTRIAIAYIRDASPLIAGTITPHHLLLNRNALFDGGLRPHHYCRPVLKRNQDRLALIEAATSGSAKYFLGTDSAPHFRRHKESSCGCAGIYSAHAAIELYAEVFEQAEALHQLERFASFNGADFYGLERNTQQISLEKRAWQVPASLDVGGDSLIPLRAGSTVDWRLVGEQLPLVQERAIS